MRKIISILLSIICVFSMSTLAFADGNPVDVIEGDPQTTEVSYTAETEYIWTVPASIAFTDNANGSSDEQTGTVSVTKSVIPKGYHLSIEIDRNEDFALTDEETGIVRHFTVSKTSGGAALYAGSQILSLAAGTNSGEQELYFNLTASSEEITGTYIGTCNFVSVVTNSTIDPRPIDR